MSNQTKKELVPKLRFPEFRETGEWEEKKLGDMGDFKNGINKDKSEFGHGVAFINLMDVFGFSVLDNKKNYGLVNANSNEIESYSLLDGDVLFIRSSVKKEGVGETTLVWEDLPQTVYSGFLIRFRCNKLNKSFKKYCFWTPTFRQMLISSSTTNANTNINQDALSNLSICIPSIPEQQKIADCLSSLDDLIAAQSQKLETLKVHKKGLMQQLFPEEGENVPKLRFPEFREAGGWKKLPIGKTSMDLLSGFPFKGSDISEDQRGIPLMRGINITEGYIRHNQDIDRFFLGDTKTLEKYLLLTNDLVIGMDGSKVGKNTALITERDSGSLLIQRVARLRTICNSTIQFIFQQINSVKFHSYVDRINTSSGIPHISLKQIEEFTMNFPPSLKEQQKIADCLSSLDDLIAVQSQKLEALKTHKKGLMQQLFPNIKNDINTNIKYIERKSVISK